MAVAACGDPVADGLDMVGIVEDQEPGSGCGFQPVDQGSAGGDFIPRGDGVGPVLVTEQLLCIGNEAVGGGGSEPDDHGVLVSVHGGEACSAGRFPEATEAGEHGSGDMVVGYVLGREAVRQEGHDARAKDPPAVGQTPPRAPGHLSESLGQLLVRHSEQGLDVTAGEFPSAVGSCGGV